MAPAAPTTRMKIAARTYPAFERERTRRSIFSGGISGKGATSVSAMRELLKVCSEPKTGRSSFAGLGTGLEAARCSAAGRSTFGRATGAGIFSATMEEATDDKARSLGGVVSSTGGGVVAGPASGSMDSFCQFRGSPYPAGFEAEGVSFEAGEEILKSSCAAGGILEFSRGAEVETREVGNVISGGWELAREGGAEMSVAASSEDWYVSGFAIAGDATTGGSCAVAGDLVEAGMTDSVLMGDGFGCEAGGATLAAGAFSCSRDEGSGSEGKWTPQNPGEAWTNSSLT